MPLTIETAWKIAHLAVALRPETAQQWTAEQVVHHLRAVANRRAGDVALATIRAALDPQARYPAVIPTPGSHWAEGVTYEPPRIPTTEDECPTHPGNWRDGCHGCRADKLAGDPTPRHQERSPSPIATEHLRSLRGIKAAATADHCRCGVPRANCAEHRDQETTDA